jgi:phosphoribosylanthranilate isomerase
MIRVKVCGITRLEDARIASSLGASALGFVFWPDSPRYIDPARARAIVENLEPFVTAVGVFVDQPRAWVQEVAATVGLGAVQLHGSETAGYIDGIGPRVIKAVAVEPDFDASVIDRLPPGVAVLLDVHDPVRRGGTGRTVDWSIAREIVKRRQTVLAGGLRAENVGLAIARVRARAVDVSSGVEASPGVKDAGRMRAFFEAVRVAGGSA